MPRIRPNQSEHKGAVTAFFAAMLAAKIHLNQANYTKVEELTDDIIKNGKFTLYPDFYQLFKIPGKLLGRIHIRMPNDRFWQWSCDLIDPGEGSLAKVPQSGSNINGWGIVAFWKSSVIGLTNVAQTVRATTSLVSRLYNSRR